MNVLTIHPALSTTNVFRPAPPAVYIDGLRRRDLHVERWNILPAPQFASARVALAMSGKYLPSRRIEHVAVLPAVGERLQIRPAGAYRFVMFDGYVRRRVAGAGPDEEFLAVEADDVLRVRLNAPITGRRQESAGSVEFVSTGSTVFNDEKTGLASEATYTVDSRTCRVFSTGPEGRLWSVSDILRYILAAFVPGDVEVSGLTEFEDHTGAIYPPALSLTGLSVRDAIARTAALAGLAARSGAGSVDGAYSPVLVFYRPGRGGQRRSIRLQRSGQTLDSRRSNLWTGRVVFQRRPARRSITVIGDLKRYESTFTLKPGWDSSLQSYHYRDFIRDEASDFPAVADVFRKWVLNESGDYCDAPYNLDKFDFSTVNGEDFILSVARRFEPCLSTDSTGAALGVVVEVSYDDGTTWRRYGGPVRISSDRCAVYLADDALPADYFQAAFDGTAKVRVTATVASDRRISAESAGDVSCPAEVVEIASARWAKVHTGSVFHQSQTLGDPLERDDTDRLARMAKSLGESRAAAVEAELTLGWVDPTCNVGDLVERIDGRRLDLATFPGSAPHVAAVEHRCGKDWTTILKVSG